MAQKPALSLDDRIRIMLSNRGNFTELTQEAEEISAAGVFSDLSDKAAYLAFVSEYKSLIKDVDAEIRGAKAQRRTPDFYARCRAQREARLYADSATLLIHLRRLGKVWSAAQKASAQKAA